MKRGDYVFCKATPSSARGIVIRMAKDGSWVDVFWAGIVIFGNGPEYWSKRMKSEALIPYGERTSLELVKRA